MNKKINDIMNIKLSLKKSTTPIQNNLNNNKSKNYNKSQIDELFRDTVNFLIMKQD